MPIRKLAEQENRPDNYNDFSEPGFNQAKAMHMKVIMNDIAAGKDPDMKGSYTYWSLEDNHDKPIYEERKATDFNINAGGDYHEFMENAPIIGYEEMYVKYERDLIEDNDKYRLIHHALQNDQREIAQKLLNGLPGTPAVKFNMLLDVYKANNSESASALSANFILQFAEQVLADQGQHMSVDKLNRVGADLREVFPNNDDVGRLCEKIGVLARRQQDEVDRIAREREEAIQRAQAEQQQKDLNGKVAAVNKLVNDLLGATSTKAEKKQSSFFKNVREQSAYHKAVIELAKEKMPKSDDRGNYTEQQYGKALRIVQDAAHLIGENMAQTKGFAKAGKSDTYKKLHDFMGKPSWDQGKASAASQQLEPEEVNSKLSNVSSAPRPRSGGRDGGV